MAEFKIEDVVDHLSTEMRRALDEAVRQVMPGAQFNSHELYPAVKRAVYRKCRIWEQVPDRFIKA